MSTLVVNKEIYIFSSWHTFDVIVQNIFAFAGPKNDISYSVVQSGAGDQEFLCTTDSTRSKMLIAIRLLYYSSDRLQEKRQN